MHTIKNIYGHFVEGFLFRGGDFLLGTDFIRQLEHHRKISHETESVLRELQLKKLDFILQFATQNIPYYSKLNVKQSSDPESWLRKFPLLTKPILRDNTNALLSVPKSSLICYPTSGSSGIQTEVFIDKKEQSLLRAILVNWWEWTGYYLGKPMFQTGMAPNRGILKSVKDLVTRTKYFIAFGLNENEILQELRKIEGKSNFHLGGYASSLYVIAEVAKKHNMNLRFDAAISWGDKMFDHYKKSVEESFQTKVFENYGLNEGFMVGMKKDLPYFYVYTPNVYLELLDEFGNEVSYGDMGHVVLTKLDGFAMPLIRYHTGDLAVRLPIERYPENRDLGFPLLERVIGRDTDLVKTPEGNTLIVHTFTGIFEFFPEIKQFKVVQHELEQIIIEYIPSDTFTIGVLSKIRNEIHKKAKTDLKIEFQKVQQISSTKSGKPQIIESSIAGNVFN